MANRPSLVAAISARQNGGVFPVISEVKARSAKEGDLLRGRDPVEYARLMATQPVAGISVVTEPVHFGGSMDTLRAVTAALGNVPVLHKDFITTTDHIDESAAAGAAALLLIAAMVDGDTLAVLVDHARRVGIETLVEAHTAAELTAVAELPCDLVGINNRDITVLEIDDTDVARTEMLSAGRPAGKPLISESAIASVADVRRAGLAGADAVLVGTAVLQATDTAGFLADLIGVGWPP